MYMYVYLYLYICIYIHYVHICIYTYTCIFKGIYWPVVKQPGNQANRHAQLPGWRVQRSSAPMRFNQATKPRAVDVKRRLGVPKPRLEVSKSSLWVPKPGVLSPSVGLGSPSLGSGVPNLGVVARLTVPTELRV